MPEEIHMEEETKEMYPFISEVPTRGVSPAEVNPITPPIIVEPEPIMT